MAEFNQQAQQKAIEDYGELQRRVSVGAYSERSAEHFETGTYPEDGVEESIDNLTELAARHDLEFIWDLGTRTWSLLPMSEETRAARRAAQEYQEDEEEDEEVEGDGSGLHQCAYCYNLVNEEHEEFCALNPNRNREIVP
jgi:hypothetical protein